MQMIPTPEHEHRELDNKAPKQPTFCNLTSNHTTSKSVRYANEGSDDMLFFIVR